MIEATRLRRLPAPIPMAEEKTRKYRLILILALVHIPLGILIYSQSVLGVIHQLGIISFALYCAIQKQIKLERVAIIVAYIVGADVLWRMANVSIYWEIGKYGSALVLLLALIRRQFHQLPILPILYFVALLPAGLITLNNQDPDLARNMLSSALSGPFFLAVSCIFFANVEVPKVAIRRILVALMLPLLSVAFVTLFYTVSASSDIKYTNESNFATSGGFGPNQVSAMLGAGAFAALLLLIIFNNSVKEKFVLACVALFMAAQSVMTFSRGGIYAAIGATLAVSVILLREPRTAVRRLAPIALAALIFLAWIFPYMDDFTGGSLSNRFEDTTGTNRTEIVEADFDIFLENPLFGAGVGSAYALRQRYLDRKAMSHTEFARLLSEHGVFGLFAFCTLLAIAAVNIKRQKTMLGRAFVVGVVVWSCLFMVNAGMRLAAPSFLWGLTFLTFSDERARLRNSNRKRFPKRPREIQLGE